MNWGTEWPWSWEEEIEWKADLEERDYDFLQELIDNAVEDIAAGYDLGPPQEESLEGAIPDEYLITA